MNVWRVAGRCNIVHSIQFCAKEDGERGANLVRHKRDDIDAMGTCKAVVAEAFGTLKVEAAKLKLHVNVLYTKYMIIGGSDGEGTVNLAGAIFHLPGRQHQLFQVHVHETS